MSLQQIMVYKKINLEELISEYDIILPKINDILILPNNGKNMREQYVSSGYLHSKDLEIMIEVLAEKYPDYIPYANEYLDGSFNIF